MTIYVKTKEAKKELNVTSATLRECRDIGKINFIRSADKTNRFYDIKEFIKSRTGKQESTRQVNYL